MRPSVGRSSPATSIMSEVLPLPEGPTRPTLSPAWMARSMPLRMLTRPAALANLRWTSSRRMMASRAGVLRAGMVGADRAMGIAGLTVEATREMRHRSSEARASRHGTSSAYVLARAIFNLTVLACAVILGPSAAWSKPAVRILMLGDSITAGYGLPEAESLPQ